MKSLYEFPFEHRYITLDGIKLHYIDEGDGPVIFLLHGMPMWSYVWRKIIPPLVEAGYRCIAPDLMGFGLSDKPEHERAHTIQRHVQHITWLIEELALTDITIVGQDWGGPISLRYAIEHKANVKSLVILNTFIERFPENQKERIRKDIITCPLPIPYTFLFKNGKFSSFLVHQFDVFRKFVWLKWKTGNPSKLLGAGMRRPVDPLAMENYFAPHAKSASRAGIAAFAKLIPNHEQHSNTTYINQIRKDLSKWDIPVLVLWPDGDMAWKPDEGERIASIVPDGEFHLIKNTGHYLQEDAGDEVATLMIDFLNRRFSNPRSTHDKRISNWR